MYMTKCIFMNINAKVTMPVSSNVNLGALSKDQAMYITEPNRIQNEFAMSGSLSTTIALEGPHNLLLARY